MAAVFSFEFTESRFQIRQLQANVKTVKSEPRKSIAIQRRNESLLAQRRIVHDIFADNRLACQCVAGGVDNRPAEDLNWKI
jgi:hypothetical protein